MRRRRAWIVCITWWAASMACQGPAAPAEAAPPNAPAAEDVAAPVHAAVGKPVLGACPPNGLYPARGLESLVDGRMGSDSYEDAEWMGWWYEDKPFEVTIDLGEAVAIRELGVHALTCSEAWILYPRKIEFEASTDGESFEPLATVTPSAAELANECSEAKVFKAPGLSARARYVRVRAQRYGELPETHLGHGGADGQEGEAWLFVDEILVNPR